MKYVVPHEIELSTMNATDPYPEWDASATYSLNDIVVVDADKAKYKCAADSSSGDTPKENPSIWVSDSMNRYALIDAYTNTQTENRDSIDFSFSAKNIDTIAFFNTEATEIYVKVEDSSGGIVYEKTVSMRYDDLQDFGDYLYSEQELRDALNSHISPYYETTVTVSIRNPGNTAKCGNLIVGRKRDLGITLWGATVNNLSTAKKERDHDWGTVKLSKGLPYKIVDIPVIVDVNLVDFVQKRLEKIDGTPCLFLADDEETVRFNSLNIFGFYNDFEYPILPKISKYTLRLESIV